MSARPPLVTPPTRTAEERAAALTGAREALARVRAAWPVYLDQYPALVELLDEAYGVLRSVAEELLPGGAPHPIRDLLALAGRHDRWFDACLLHRVLDELDRVVGGLGALVGGEGVRGSEG